jgi:hypothetical protein
MPAIGLSAGPRTFEWSIPAMDPPLAPVREWVIPGIWE